MKELGFCTTSWLQKVVTVHSSAACAPRPPVAKWQPLYPGFFKLNMDDAYLESYKVVGVGAMLGYSNGQFIVGMTKTKHWVSSPKHAC